MKCPICLSVNERNIITNCFHSFCERCLKNCADYNGICQCPICQKIVDLMNIDKQDFNISSSYVDNTNKIFNWLKLPFYASITLRCDEIGKRKIAYSKYGEEFNVVSYFVTGAVNKYLTIIVNTRYKQYIKCKVRIEKYGKYINNEAGEILFSKHKQNEFAKKNCYTFKGMTPELFTRCKVLCFEFRL